MVQASQMRNTAGSGGPQEGYRSPNLDLPPSLVERAECVNLLTRIRLRTALRIARESQSRLAC